MAEDPQNADEPIVEVREPEVLVLLPEAFPVGAMAWIEQHPGVHAKTSPYCPPGVGYVIRMPNIEWEPSWLQEETRG